MLIPSRAWWSEAESKEKHSVWDPMPESTTTSPYVHSGVDYNIFTMGNPMSESTLILCQNHLYPPVRDFGFGLWGSAEERMTIQVSKLLTRGLCQECWHQDPESRPKFEELQHGLEFIIAENNRTSRRMDQLSNIYIKTPKPKCRLFLKIDQYSKWRKVFIYLRPPVPFPPPPPPVTLGRGVEEPVRRLEGRQFTRGV